MSQIPSQIHATRYDPTDDHTRGGLPEAQARRGVCSAPGCAWPIAGWCEQTPALMPECRAQFCFDHLYDHRTLHARQARATRAYRQSLAQQEAQQKTMQASTHARLTLDADGAVVAVRSSAKHEPL